jgi:hypothetical protein
VPRPRLGNSLTICRAERTYIRISSLKAYGEALMTAKPRIEELIAL